MSIRVPVSADKSVGRLGPVTYIGIGKCNGGADALTFESVADNGIVRETGAVTYRSLPFAEFRSVPPDTCTLLKTAAMNPFARHYRTRLLRVAR